MGELTTHILDLTQGTPASNVRIDLYEVNASVLTFLKSAATNHDGRLDAPLIDASAFSAGVYELHVHIGAYFRKAKQASSTPAFLDIVTVRFGVDDPGRNYHVPLLVSPWGYQVYRGS
ncbi:hydroxyisourate hydrolase [Sporolactobacillus inulinus]|uniref:5-hydroxyisourate hydrolase n=1 Tax=Sporolactobacillus inulinus CASD TaxID=1069536 RepID=A0A0U1QQK4_9BACL|nr:hydroxyisourate hydrolase [Sporolactobacillus inulinus]KLI03093.1 5-hydroxyisourate hydrolase [Sporolactobacillus inulinus CASD]GEB77271.1 5-hydroxyisourate hydrolase [Sporolactobacillus inulinus]